MTRSASACASESSASVDRATPLALFVRSANAEMSIGAVETSSCAAGGRPGASPASSTGASSASSAVTQSASSSGSYASVCIEVSSGADCASGTRSSSAIASSTPRAESGTMSSSRTPAARESSSPTASSTMSVRPASWPCTSHFANSSSAYRRARERTSWSGARSLSADVRAVDVVGGRGCRGEPLQIGRGVSHRQAVPLEHTGHVGHGIHVLEEEGCRSGAAEDDGGLEPPELVGIDRATPAVHERARRRHGSPRRDRSVARRRRAPAAGCAPADPRCARSKGGARAARRGPRRSRSPRRDRTEGARHPRGSREGSPRRRRGHRRGPFRRAVRERGRAADRARPASARAGRAPRRRVPVPASGSAGARTTTRRPSSSSASAAS